MATLNGRNLEQLRRDREALVREASDRIETLKDELMERIREINQICDATGATFDFYHLNWNAREEYDGWQSSSAHC